MTRVGMEAMGTGHGWESCPSLQPHPLTALLLLPAPPTEPPVLPPPVSPQACGCPLYWKGPLFYSAGGERTGSVSVHKFVVMWRK